MRVFLRTQIRESVLALDRISLTFEGGRIYAVAGPNGAGKTTLFKILTGLLAPTSGSASVLGIDATQQSTELRRVVGFMSGEDRSLYLRLTCVQNLEFRGRLQGLRGPRLSARIAEVLGDVGLGDVGDRVGFALSAGMRARLQLACALLHDPPVLILDEPTGAVDPLGSFELLEMIKRVTSERALAVLFSTHRVDEIEALGEKVVLLHRGRIVHMGGIDQLRGDLDRQRVTFRFATPADARRAAALIDGSSETEVVAAQDDLLTLATGVRIGVLLDRLGELASTIASVNEERAPLREVMARVLTDQADERAVPAP